MWRAITETDVVTQISGAELDALREAVLADGQDDPVQPCIDDVTAEVLGYVAASGAELDSDTSKVPDRLIGAAVSKIIILIMTRAAGTMIDPEGARAKAADKANTLLRDVAAKRFSITDPESGSEASQGGATVVNKRTPRVSRDNLKGF